MAAIHPIAPEAGTRLIHAPLFRRIILDDGEMPVQRVVEPG